MSKKQKSKFLHTPVPFLQLFILAFILTLGCLVLFEDMFKNSGVLGVSTKNKVEKGVKGNSVGKKIENVNAKTVRAQEHVEKVKNVVAKLEEVAETAENLGNEDVTREISEVVEDIEERVADAVEPMEEIEARPGWKNFLFGTNYKNLGQLRSSLVHTENNIRKLTRTMERVEGEESGNAIQEQLGVLNQERERIRSMIEENESSFSLLGWVFRFLSGYNNTPSESETVEVEEPLE